MTNPRAFTPDEMMTVAARGCCGTDACASWGSASRRRRQTWHGTRTPDIVLIYESGTVGTRPDVLPLSIGDGELADTATAVVPLPEVFAYWLQGGRIDVGFLGAAQMDRFGNLNSTVIGSYKQPRTRLPAAAERPRSPPTPGRCSWCSSSRRAPSCGAGLLQQRRFPDRGRRARALRRARSRAAGDHHGLRRAQPEAGSDELQFVARYEHTTVEQAVNATGWPLNVAARVDVVAPPARTNCGS